MNIACPECSTIYRVDPDRVPDEGVTTRCRECDTEFRVNHALAPAEPGEFVTAPRVEAAEAVVGEVGDPLAAEPGPEVPVGEGHEEPATTPGEGAAPVEEAAGGEAAEEPTPAEAATEAGTAAAGGGVEAGTSPEEGAEARTGPSEPSEPTAAVAPSTDEAPVFGPQDPDTRARRLARALVSDIKVYHPEKWEEAVQEGTLRKDFRDEILKSWEEYVEQVGEEMAKKTPYFRDALNEILARGERVF